jgi:hypothetical protein
MSPRTLERWRWLRQGPAFLKLGKCGHVIYRLEDIESYEQRHLHLAELTSFLEGEEDLEARRNESQGKFGGTKQARPNCSPARTDHGRGDGRDG